MSLLAALALFSGCNEGGLLEYEPYINVDGEEFSVYDLELNARPKPSQNLDMLYDGYALKPLVSLHWVDSGGAYLLFQTREGLDEKLMPVPRSPIQLRAIYESGGERFELPVPTSLGEDLAEALDRGCGFLQTDTPRLLAMQCDGDIIRLLPEADAWEEAAAGVDPENIRIVTGEVVVLHDGMVIADGRRRDVFELTSRLGANSSEESWIGVVRDARMRVFYKRGLELCSGVISFLDDTVVEDGCVGAEVPGVTLVHSGGSVDKSVFFGEGGTNGVERGALFYARVSSGGGVSIVGKPGGEPSYLPDFEQRYPQLDVLIGENKIGVNTPSSKYDIDFVEVFDFDDGWDYERLPERKIVGRCDLTCPDGEPLKVCRCLGGSARADAAMLTYARPDAVWKIMRRNYDARSRVFAQFEEKEKTVITRDPARTFEPYELPGPEVTIALRARTLLPGYAPSGDNDFYAYGACARVVDEDGVSVPTTPTDITIDIHTSYRLEVSGCEVPDGGNSWAPVEVAVASYIERGDHDPWSLDGVPFVRGNPFYGESDAVHVVAGANGAMLVGDATGWHLLRAVEDGALESSIVDDASSVAPAFVGHGLYVVLAGGDVLNASTGARESFSMTGVQDPSKLHAHAFGSLYSYQDEAGTRIWSVEDGAIALLEDVNHPPEVSLLDVSSGAGVMLFGSEASLEVRVAGGEILELWPLVASAVSSDAHIDEGGQEILARYDSGQEMILVHYHMPQMAGAEVGVREIYRGEASAYAFDRVTGRVLMRSDAPRGEETYNTTVVYQPGLPDERLVVPEARAQAFAVDRSRVYWAQGYMDSLRVRSLDWGTLEARDVELDFEPSSRPEAITLIERDGVFVGVKFGDWYRARAGALERASWHGFEQFDTGKTIRYTIPLSSGLGATIYTQTPEATGYDSRNALMIGARGEETRVTLEREVMVFDPGLPSDMIFAYWSMRQEDVTGDLLDAPCVLLPHPGAPEGVVSEVPSWVCLR
jgi:hypothetical protein